MAINVSNQGASYIPLIDQIRAMVAKNNAPGLPAINELGVMAPEEKMDLFGIAKIPKPQMIPLETGQLPGMGPLSGRK